jgi:hypothetical protein
MKPQVGDLRTVTQRFDGEQWVLCLQSMPPRELSDDEIMEVIERIEYSPAEVSLSYDYEMRIARAILKKASEK